MQVTVFSELFNYDIEEAKRMTKEKLALEVIDQLKKEYPDAGCTLDYDQAWKLLVSVRLAAQCTDARVNVVVEDLYAKYPDVASLAAAEPEEMRQSCARADSAKARRGISVPVCVSCTNSMQTMYRRLLRNF